MGKGKQFELDTKRDLNENTRPWVKAHRPDFSGNSAGEAADVMVVWQAERYEAQRPCGHAERFVAYAELKKRSGEAGNRTIVMSGSSEDQTGLEELQELRHELPSWAQHVVGIKFPSREMITLDARALEHHLRRDEEGWGPNYCDYRGVDTFHGARLTPSDNISMIMPELDDWPSQQAGLPPWKKLALHVGLEFFDMTDSKYDED